MRPLETTVHLCLHFQLLEQQRLNNGDVLFKLTQLLNVAHTQAPEQGGARGGCYCKASQAERGDTEGLCHYMGCVAGAIASS